MRLLYVCAYYIYMYAPIMRVCTTRVGRIQGPAQPKHYSATWSILFNASPEFQNPGLGMGLQFSSHPVYFS